MSNEKHTPTPWYVGKDNYDVYDITDADGGNTIAVLEGSNGEMDAELIVEAVNNHDHLKSENERMRKALTLIQHATSPQGNDDSYHEAAWELATDALAAPLEDITKLSELRDEVVKSERDRELKEAASNLMAEIHNPRKAAEFDAAMTRLETALAAYEKGAANG